MVISFNIKTSSQGLLNITREVNKQFNALLETQNKNPKSDGLCTLFVRHTSASLIIQENADPSAKRDLEVWLNHLVKENDPLYTHTLEGSDDMPAHIKSILTATSISIPFMQSELALGTWQGIYLWEHRHLGGSREIVMHIG